MSFDSKKESKKDLSKSQSPSNMNKSLPHIFNPNNTITDSVISINIDKIETSKLEECSSLSPNLDDTYANLIDTKEIHDIFSLIILKLTLISSLSINYDEGIEEIKKLVDSVKESLKEKIDKEMIFDDNDIKMLRKYIRSKSAETIRRKIKKSKGEKYCQSVIISNIKEFGKYYNNLIPSDLKDKEKVSFEDALQSKDYYINCFI